jgi:hypothetical protein
MLLDIFDITYVDESPLYRTMHFIATTLYYYAYISTVLCILLLQHMHTYCYKHYEVLTDESINPPSF